LQSGLAEEFWQLARFSFVGAIACRQFAVFVLAQHNGGMCVETEILGIDYKPALIALAIIVPYSTILRSSIP
jgi:hypothetical protein